MFLACTLVDFISDATLLRYSETLLQVSSLGSPLQVQGDAAGKGTCALSFRMLGSRPTGGIALRSTGGATDGSARGEDGIAVGDIPSSCARSGFGGSEPEIRGGGGGAPGGIVSGVGEEIAEENARRQADAIGGGSIATGRSDNSALRVNTGAAGLTVSDWSLQSCDDADDGAVSYSVMLRTVVPTDTKRVPPI